MKKAIPAWQVTGVGKDPEKQIEEERVLIMSEGKFYKMYHDLVRDYVLLSRRYDELRERQSIMLPSSILGVCTFAMIVMGLISEIPI